MDFQDVLTKYAPNQTDPRDKDTLEAKAITARDREALRLLMKHVFDPIPTTINEDTPILETCENHPWLPECDISPGELATCQIIPCNHRVSKEALDLEIKRIYDLNKWNANNSGNKIDFKCPFCKVKWDEVRCTSQKGLETKMNEILKEATIQFPPGPLRKKKKKIYNFILFPETLDGNGDFLQIIAQCILKNTINNENLLIIEETEEETEEETKGETAKQTVRLSNTSGDPTHILAIKIDNNKELIIKIITCFKESIKDYISKNWPTRGDTQEERFVKSLEKAISEMDKSELSGIIVGDPWREQPIGWILTKSLSDCDNALTQVSLLDDGHNISRIIPIDHISHMSMGDAILNAINRGREWTSAVFNSPLSAISLTALAASVLFGTTHRDIIGKVTDQYGLAYNRMVSGRYVGETFIGNNRLYTQCMEYGDSTVDWNK